LGQAWLELDWDPAWLALGQRVGCCLALERSQGAGQRQALDCFEAP